VVPSTSFLPSVRGLEFPLFDGGSPAVTVGSAGSLCTVWVGLLASAEKQIATQWTGEM
jgi:hypothetical protein